MVHPRLQQIDLQNRVSKFKIGGDLIKFSGKIGFWKEDVETSPGVYAPAIIERFYVGDILRNIRRSQTGEYANDDLAVNNQISITSDLYLRDNWGFIKYALWNGVKWKVNSIDLSKYPKIFLELGGVYNNGTST